jgi:hypothetical protein
MASFALASLDSILVAREPEINARSAADGPPRPSEWLEFGADAL